MERVAAGYPLRQGGHHGTWKFSGEAGSSRLLAGVRKLPPLRGLQGAAPASCLSALLAVGKGGRRVRRRNSDRTLLGWYRRDRPAAHRVPELRGGSPVHPRAPGTPPSEEGGGEEFLRIPLEPLLQHGHLRLQGRKTPLVAVSQNPTRSLALRGDPLP